MYSYCLYIAVHLLRLVLFSLMIEQPLALMHGPLQLPREDREVVVALQAISTSENVNSKLGGGNPKATIGHGSESNRETTSATFHLFLRFPNFLTGLESMCF